MFESVNMHSSVAVFVQIENLVQFGIASGRLQAGDELPSPRKLSKKLGVNPNTVVKAYRDLNVMGIVFTRRSMGVFINKGVEAKCRQECRNRIANRIREVVAEAKAMSMTKGEIKGAIEKSYASEAGPYSGPHKR